ncbi:hypothetical protein FSARC_11278 [Fusarium sarcochroum]|uniref:Ankyrin n=1 Tax=Fusarium sarcochroum TaxID=1208366 RepID=A0A8H4TGF3_9HYPO|nr:hypothetical protein FSARC_11278 [Fusarium sarcochroum]
MADPLSLAASIAGLISLADVAFKCAYKFVRAAKDAKDDILSLADEINNLASVLRVLGALASDLEADGEQFDPTLRNHYLNHCFKTLTRIETRVKKAADSFSRSKLEGIYRQLKWPFSSSETKDLLAELSRHKETINVALAADSMRKLQLSLSKSDELGKQISAIGEVVRKIEINTLIDVNDKKQRVLDYFMKRNPQPSLETSIRLRHSMTGLWLTESPNFVRWLDTPSSKLWLTGIPGAGKTVLAGSAIQEVLSRSYSTQGIGVAFFFCDYKDSATWQTVNILGAVASQLARQNNEAFDTLNRYHEDLNPPRGLPQTPDPDELRALISRMSELFGQTIIVIDGLDECGDCTDDVLDMLIQLNDYSEGTSLAIFSRDHFNIRVQLEQDFEIFPIAAHTNDIQLYVNSEIEKRIRTKQLQLANMEIREEIQEVLVRRADGMFRWVVCQLDYLCECAHDEERREALNKLPPDLPESYRRLLERVNRCSPRVQEIVQMCLHFMTLTKPRLTILELRQAVSAPSAPGEILSESNTVSEQEITRRCSSLIRKSEDGVYFEFAHFSVQEFLEDKNAVSCAVGLEKYWISDSTVRSLLAEQCLRFLLLKNFGKLPTEFEGLAAVVHARDDNYPFYRHAAVEWIKLTEDGLDDSTILALVGSLFQRSKHANFIFWAIEVLERVIADTSICNVSEDAQEPDRQAWGIATHSSFRPLHMAAALNLPEICGLLHEDEPSANHIFNSASCLDLALVSVLAIPGMASLRGYKKVEYGIANTARYQFLPSSKRRNTTIDYLIKAGEKPSDRSLSPNTVSVFSITCIFAAVFNDLTPVTSILSCNITPLGSEIQILDDWIKSIDAFDPMAELSSRTLLQYLDTTDALKTEWGKEIGSTVLNWALMKSFSFANDPNLSGTGISTSKDALLTRLFSAISSDNADLTAHCLSDDRLDKHTSYTDEGYTLLHLAVINNAFEVFKLLMAEGCDPYAQTVRGDMPIHYCERRYGPRPFKVFKDLEISLLSQNKSGCNIWHLWVIDEPIDYQFASDMFELDPESTILGLQAKTTQDDTPLTLLFRYAGAIRNGGHMSKAKSLTLECSRIASLWQNYAKVSNKKTDLESTPATNKAVEDNPEFQAMINTDRVALYNFGPYITLEDIKLLMTLYPQATSCRVEGKLPIEHYIMSILRGDVVLTEGIVEALFPQNIMESQSGAEQTLWSFACSIASQTNYRPIYEGWNASYDKESSLNAVLSTMLRLGAMKAHERQLKQSGLVPLLAKFRASHPHIDNLDNCGYPSLSMIREVSLHTEFWAGLKDLESTSRLFQAAIHEGDLEMVRILLKHKVSPNIRAHGHSPIEVAFDASTALRICSSEDGTALFKELIKQSNNEDLKQISPTDNKSSLLHRLATSEEASSILWLAEALVQRGLDINQVGSGYRAESALTHHLRESSFQFVELFLGLGANLSNNGQSPYHAIYLAITQDNVAFLRTVLAHANKTAMPVNWNVPVDFDIEPFDQNVRITQGNAVHLASGKGSTNCLEFLIDEGLVTQNSASTEGFTPVHAAAFGGFTTALQLLLTNGFSATTESQFGYTPLHMAVRSGSLPAVECLLEHDASDSFDAFGKTSRRLASELGFTTIVELLDKATEGGGKPRLDIQKRGLSRQQTKRLTMAFEQAVREGDYDTLEMIVSSGNSIDNPLCSGEGGSALILALELQNWKIVQWLLDHGASTLTAKYTNAVEDSVIEIASARAERNGLLPKLLEIYLGEGGDLISGDDFPFHDAVWNHNDQGLEYLLLTIELPLKYNCIWYHSGLRQQQFADAGHFQP